MKEHFQRIRAIGQELHNMESADGQGASKAPLAGPAPVYQPEGPVRLQEL